MKPFLAMASAVLLALTTNPAAAAAPRIGSFILYPDVPDALVLHGVIGSNTASDLRKALAARPGTKYIILHSQGGYVDSALKVANMIRSRGLHTVVPSSFHCLSACAFVFFAGREHVVTGQLGVHRIAADGSNNASATNAAFGHLQNELKAYGIPKGVMKRMAATPSQSMHVFSNKEIKELSINRGGSARTMELANR